MKLRIRGNTLRLRLTRSEVAQLGAGQSVREETPFPNGSVFAYELRPADICGAQQISQAAGTDIVVTVPESDATHWAQSDEVGFSGDGPFTVGTMEILIEKDFTCITPREGEEELDTYPNPNVA